MIHPSKKFLDQVDNLIEEYLDDPNLIVILNENLYLSYSQIYRKIKQKSGHTPSTYIRKKRLTIAQQWLAQTDAQIQEIATQTGFQSLSYFSRCFSEEYGFPPSRFRGGNSI